MGLGVASKHLMIAFGIMSAWFSGGGAFFGRDGCIAGAFFGRADCLGAHVPSGGGGFGVCGGGFGSVEK